MFLKYDLKDPVASYTFSGLLNINNVALVETHSVGQNGKRIEVHLPSSVILLYKSSTENVNEVYEHIIDQLFYYKKNGKGISVTLAGELGTMEIL